MSAEDQTPISRLANSVALVLISRIAMTLAAGALPIAFNMLQSSQRASEEIIRRIDAVRDQSFEIKAQLQLIKEIEARQGEQIADHEARLRDLFNRVHP